MGKNLPYDQNDITSTVEFETHVTSFHITVLLQSYEPKESIPVLLVLVMPAKCVKWYSFKCPLWSFVSNKTFLLQKEQRDG